MRRRKASCKAAMKGKGKSKAARKRANQKPKNGTAKHY